MMPFDMTDDLGYEIYALLIIQSLFPHGNHIVRETIDGKTLDFEYFKKAESPDWQSQELGIGLEVTVAMDEKEIVDSITFSKAVKGASSLEEVKGNLKNLDKKQIFKAEVSQPHPDFYMMGHDQPDNLGLLAKTIEKKVESSKKYMKFQDNWLFIFFVGYLDKEKIAETISNVPGHEFFNRYIINPLGNNDGVYYIEKPYNEVTVRNHASMSEDIVRGEVEKVRAKL